VGEILSKSLKMPFFGMDAKIVEEAGMSIPEIVEKYGWFRFRELESDLVRKLSGADNLVIDTGGGVVERPENISLLKINAYIIWLKASVNTIIARIQKDTQRPSLTRDKSFTEEVEEVLKQRIPKYKSAAQFEIDTDNLVPEQVANKVLELLPIRFKNRSEKFEEA
jgi:shikimate kinase